VRIGNKTTIRFEKTQVEFGAFGVASMIPSWIIRHLDETIWFLTLPRVKRISGSKNFSFANPKRLLQQYPSMSGHRQRARYA
jgi:hypothetical protein